MDKSRIKFATRLNIIVGLGVIALVVVVSAIYFWRNNVDPEDDHQIEVILTPTPLPSLQYDGVRNYIGPIGASDGALRQLFNDKNAVQLAAAKKYGIRPLATDASLPALVEDSALVKVPRSNHLTNSTCTYPYLTPEAYDMLLEIAARYNEKCGGRSRLRFTSGLRTEDFIRNHLRKKNGNSVTNSAHLYGTTFDLSYAYMNPEHKEALARTLKEPPRRRLYLRDVRSEPALLPHHHAPSRHRAGLSGK